MLDEALNILRRVPDSYRYTTLPCLIDDDIAKVVTFVVNASPEQQQEFYHQVDKQASYNLLTFAERMSMLSVRRKSADVLLKGLIALAMTGPAVDFHFITITLSLLHNSALKLNLEVDKYFRQAAQYANKFSSAEMHLLSFLRREPRLKRIEAMGYREIEGPSGLIYWSGESPIPEGLLYQEAVAEGVILQDLQDFFDKFFSDPTLSGKYEIEHQALRQLGPEERARLEDKLLKALEAGSRDSRVLLGLGSLASERATVLLKDLLASAKNSLLVNAAVALWYIERDPELLYRVIDVLLQSPYREARMDAAFALRHFCCVEAAKALKQALKDECNFVRYHALKSLLKVYNLPRGEVNMPLLTSLAMSDAPESLRDLIGRIRDLTDHLALPNCQC